MLRLPFEIKPCPQDCGKECGMSLDKCPVYPKLPTEFQEVCQENPHLLQYLHSLPEDGSGTPTYYEKITRSLKGIQDPNLIYQVGGGVFIHVLANPEDVRDYYIAVEPSMVDAQDETLEEIERRLADSVEELEDIDDPKQRIEIIMGIVDRLVVVSNRKASVPDENKNSGKNSLSLKSKGNNKTKINVTAFQ